VVALGYGLFLWILSVFTIVSYEFARFRVFWSTPGAIGLSNFQLAAVVGCLFTLVVLLTATAEWRSSRARPWGLLATYAASLSVVVAWGVNFYGMATIPLNDEWYYEAIVDEPYDIHRVYLGQVVSAQPCEACPEGTAALSVALETNDTAQVMASQTENPVGSIVAVHELKGRFTGAPRYEFYLSVPVDDAELFKRFWFRARSK
jgi:hypothetical protein